VIPHHQSLGRTAASGYWCGDPCRNAWSRQPELCRSYEHSSTAWRRTPSHDTRIGMIKMGAVKNPASGRGCGLSPGSGSRGEGTSRRTSVRGSRSAGNP
jgi:hypothetical protein